MKFFSQNFKAGLDSKLNAAVLFVPERRSKKERISDLKSKKDIFLSKYISEIIKSESK